MNTGKKTLIVGVLAFTAVAAAGCMDKAAEPWNDAKVSHRDDSPAEIYSMPDGFNNFAEKCDRYGNRVITMYHGDDIYGAVAVVPNDPTCKR